MIGEHMKEDESSIYLGYPSTLVSPSEDTRYLVPMPLSGDLIGPSFGRDSTTSIQKNHTFLCTVVEASLTEKSEHPVIDMFLKYWSLYDLPDMRAKKQKPQDSEPELAKNA